MPVPGRPAIMSMSLLVDQKGAAQDQLTPRRAEEEEAVHGAEQEERGQARQRAAHLAPRDRAREHWHQHRRNVDDVSEEQPRAPQDEREHREEEEVERRGDEGVPERDRHRGAQVGNLEEPAPVEAHVLHEAVRPAPKLLRQEAERSRLDGIAHRPGHEPHLPAALVEAPGEVHVLGHGPIGPAPQRPQRVGAIHRVAARGDQRLAVRLLDRLVEGEGEEGLDVAAPLPDAPDPPRPAEATPRGTTTPHAAAVAARSNAGSSRSIASGASVVSASRAMTSGVVTRSRAKVWAPAFEPVFRSGRSTRTPRRRASTPVRSVEQSSTTRISRGRTVWARMLRIVSASVSASLKAGTMTVTGADASDITMATVPGWR